MYRTVSADLQIWQTLSRHSCRFFSQLDVKSLFDNFPDFVQDKTRIAAFGTATCPPYSEANLILDIQAPTPETPSMTMALEAYLTRSINNHYSCRSMVHLGFVCLTPYLDFKPMQGWLRFLPD